MIVKTHAQKHVYYMNDNFEHRYQHLLWDAWYDAKVKAFIGRLRSMYDFEKRFRYMLQKNPMYCMN